MDTEMQVGVAQPSEAENYGVAPSTLYGATRLFLNALVGAYEGDLSFELFEKIVQTGNPDFLSTNHGDLRLYPDSADGILFLFAAASDTERDDYQSCRLTPSAVLWKDGVSIYCWAFDKPVEQTDQITALMTLFGMETLEEAIPLPGTDGWELVHADLESSYTPDTLIQTYLAEDVVDEDAVEMYNDAKIVTPFDINLYRGLDIAVTLGQNQFSKTWKPVVVSMEHLIKEFTTHTLGKKDGTAAVFADMVPGQRVKKAVKTCTAIGLDIDTGTPSNVIDKSLAKLGCLAMRTSTHSHGKRSSEFSKDRVVKFRPDAEEINTELMRDFVREVERWDKSIIDSVEFVEEDHSNEKGIVYRISHKEMPKHRIVIPLAHPYVIADEGKTQQEAIAKWAKVPEAMAGKLGVPFDRSCTDPSRLFYLPRHDKNKPFEISLFGGPLFDHRDLSLENAFDAVAADFAKGKGKSVTAEGKKLGKWFKDYAHGFQIMDVIEHYAPDRKRSKASSGYNIECPFDEDHSNSGDRNDQACFAVNAADGGNEFFSISCRHETCRDKTVLDMVGKMVKDEWFEESALTDENFNIAEIEAVSVRKEEGVKSEQEVQSEIDALLAGLANSADQHSDIVQLADLALTAHWDALKIDFLKRKIREAINSSDKKPLNDLFKERKRFKSEAKAAGAAPETKYWFRDESLLARAMDKEVSVVSLGAQRRFVVHDHNDIPHFLQKSDAEIAFAQYRYFREVGDKGEEGFKVWLRSPHRFTGYKEVVFLPGDDPVAHDVLNLWRGWGVEPKEGDWSLLRAHIKSIICNGDLKAYKYYMAWLAQMIQEPTIKPGVAPALVGPKGSGKSTVVHYVRKLIPKNSKVVEKPRSWLGSFNSGLAHCLLLCVEEAMFAGSHEHDSAMKNLITNDQLLYEAKYQNAVEGPNFTRVHITSNEDWVVPATPGERRYFVLKVNPSRVKDFAYFKAIADQMDAGGCEAMLYDLLRWDYSDINLRESPETEGLRDQISTGLDPKLKWLASVLEYGSFPFKDGRGPDVTDWINARPTVGSRSYAADAEQFELTGVSTCIPKKIVFASYRDFCPGYREPETDEAIAKFLMGFDMELERKRMTMPNGDRPWAYVFPSLVKIREAFLKKVPTHAFGVGAGP